MGKVVLVKTKNYQQEETTASVTQIFDELELSSSFSGKRVTIKPNLLMKRHPEEATTSHPSIVEAVVKKVQSLGAKEIILADSPGGPYSHAQLSSIYSATGMTSVADRTGIKLNYDTSYREVSAPMGEYTKNFNIISPLIRENTDYIISIGKVKTHCMTTMSGGVKNLFGSVPGLQKPELHYRFQDKRDFCGMLVDLALVVAPELTIMDGVESMEGDGPSAGKVRKTDFLAAATNPFFLDRLLCRMLGFSSDEVPTVANSIIRNLCPEDVREIEVANFGDVPLVIQGFLKPQSKSVDFTDNLPQFLIKPFIFMGKHFFSSKPVVQYNKCIGCGKCAESCPSKTIYIIDKKAKINYDKCIKCYCCHEMCPVKAIDVKRTILTRF